MRRSGNAEAAYVTWQACKNRFGKAWKAWRESRFCADKDLRDSSFKYRGNVWLFLEDKGCIHGLENCIHNKHSIIQRLVAKNLDSEIVSKFDS